MNSASAGFSPNQPELAKIIFSLEELADLKRAATQERPYAQRLSAGLIVRLLTTAKGDAPYVLDAIDALEGVRPHSNIKSASQFRYPPLHPLWHRHFFAPRHMMRNVGERWGIARGEGNIDLDQMIGGVANEHGQDPDIWPGVLAHEFVDGYAERSRSRRLTGDWIVFAEYEGSRYYLDLASHEEGKGERAERLLTKLRNSALAEFSFAFSE